MTILSNCSLPISLSRTVVGSVEVKSRPARRKEGRRLRTVMTRPEGCGCSLGVASGFVFGFVFGFAAGLAAGLVEAGCRFR